MSLYSLVQAHTTPGIFTAFSIAALVFSGGSVWNGSLGERIDKRLHDEAGTHLQSGKPMSPERAIEAHKEKDDALHFKASGRVWTATAILLSVIAIYTRPA